MPLTQRETDRRRAELPQEVRRVLDAGQATARAHSPEYEAAVRPFYNRHVGRLDPWPREIVRTMELMDERPVYAYRNGATEFSITGTMRDVDLSPRLGEIRPPTLVLGGRHDEVTPVVAEQLRRGIPGARSVTFEASSPMPFGEELGRVLEVVRRFLDTVDGRPSLR